MRWNEERRSDILAVHRAYVAAGCRFITTNSFGGTRSMLARHAQADRTRDWNRMAAEIAREAAGPEHWVLGDVGPFGDFLEPMGDTSEEELLETFKEQIGALLEGGADAILVETMSDPGEAVVAVQAAKALASTTPVIVTYAFQKSATGEFRTMMGASVADALQRALDAGAEIVGANCGTDLALEDYVWLAAELHDVAAVNPGILQPNAGAPRPVSEGVVYDASPEEMAAAAIRIRDAGIGIVGGCCGTTPDHLQAMTAALRGAAD